jgi:hypothetical protein
MFLSDQTFAPEMRLTNMRLTGIRPADIRLSQRLMVTSNPAKQHQYEDDDQHDAKAAAAVITGPVKWAAANAAKSTQQRDYQDNQYYGSEGHFRSSNIRLRHGAQLTMLRDDRGCAQSPRGFSVILFTITTHSLIKRAGDFRFHPHVGKLCCFVR